MLQKKLPYPLPSSHHNLDLPHLELRERTLPPNLYRLPGYIVDPTGLLVDEVMVPLGVGIKHQPAFSENLRLDHPLLSQKI